MSEQESLFRQLQSRIRVIVADNSGGLKMTKLVTDLACQDIAAGKRGFSIDEVMRAIDEDPTLNAHEYVWHMGEQTPELAEYREKVFVHQIGNIGDIAFEN